MSGQISDTNYSEVKEKHLSDQCVLGEFSEDQTTYIAVVSLPRRSIEKYVDEVMTDLGMPQWALKRFLQRRAGYRGNSAVDDAHNKAYEDVHLEGIYYNHLETEAAQRCIKELTDRVIAGENITLVCYEEDGKSCHRHILVDMIQEEVTRRENCRFQFSSV